MHVYCKFIWSALDGRIVALYLHHIFLLDLYNFKQLNAFFFVICSGDEGSIAEKSVTESRLVWEFEYDSIMIISCSP